MASRFNCSISSFVLSDLNNSNDSDDEDFDERNVYEDNDYPSEFSVTDDLETGVIETDYDDYNLEISGDRESEMFEDSHENHSESSFELDLDQQCEENSTKPEIKKKLNSYVDNFDAESVDPSQKCPICLGAWTTTGKHRLCSLRCGHIFGFSCIQQWLKSDNESAERCPQCNTRASLQHIRFLYANKVISVDSSDLEKMQKQVKKWNERYHKIKKALVEQKKRTRKYKLKYRSLADSDLC